MSAVSRDTSWECPGTSQFLPSLLAIFELDTMALSLWSFPEWFCFFFALCEVPVLCSLCLNSKKQHRCLLKYWELKLVTEFSFCIPEDEAECQQDRKGSSRGCVCSCLLVLQMLRSPSFSRCPDWGVLGFSPELRDVMGQLGEMTCRGENATWHCRCIGDTEKGMLRASCRQEISIRSDTETGPWKTSECHHASTERKNIPGGMTCLEKHSGRLTEAGRGRACVQLTEFWLILKVMGTTKRL